MAHRHHHLHRVPGWCCVAGELYGRYSIDDRSNLKRAVLRPADDRHRVRMFAGDAMSEGKFYTARDLIRELRKLPPDMKVEFSPINRAWLGAMKPQRAFQVEVWSSKGNHARKPYSKSAHAQIYIGDEQP